MTSPAPRDEYVLDVVCRIPPGRLASYGDVAMVLQECGVACTARHVARALSRFGAEVPWWRVVQSAGTVAEPVLARAREHLAAEGIAVEGRRVPLDRLRWQPDPDVLREVLQRGGLL